MPSDKGALLLNCLNTELKIWALLPNRWGKIDGTSSAEQGRVNSRGLTSGGAAGLRLEWTFAWNQTVTGMSSVMAKPTSLTSLKWGQTNREISGKMPGV